MSRMPNFQDDKWGVILAGGDGTRLLDLTRLVFGDARPEQFCGFFGEHSLLAQTCQRAQRSISAEHILIPVSGAHRSFYIREPGIRPSQRIVQLANKGTAPAIVYSLLSIERHNRNALVAILPSDHHHSDEHAFTATLESAFDTAARHRDSVVLLGTFVMVGRVGAFLDMIGAARTGLRRTFPPDRLWSGTEVHLPPWLYDRFYAIDFSRDILSLQAQRLIALIMENIQWNDLGRPERVMDVLSASGLKPWWMKEWHALKRPPGTFVVPIGEAAVA